MKTMKTLLAVIMAVCLVMSLSIAAFATETTAPAATTTATEAAGDVTTLIATEGATEPVDDAEAVTEPAEDAEATGEEHDHDHDHEEEAVEEPGWKKTLRVIITVLEVLASIALGVIVLMQSGKEAGLSGAISGNSDSYMSKGGKGGMDKMLAKSTKWVALAWLLLTLALSLI